MSCHAQARLLLHGSDTLLGDAAAESELFVTNCHIDVPLQGLSGPASAVFRLQRTFSADLRLQQQQDDAELGAQNASAREEGGLCMFSIVQRHCLQLQLGIVCASHNDDDDACIAAARQRVCSCWSVVEELLRIVAV
jgi:hypothetical protein